jgi:lipopolysaccharide assembly outer membrane protein LptD (OstA)
MNKKSVIQLVLSLTVIFILIITYFRLFNTPQNIVSINQKKTIQEVEDEEKNLNKIENLEYIATDSLGNKYIIKADRGYLNKEDQKLIMMSKVSAEIVFSNAEEIYILSDTAIYNSQNFDTHFSNKIKVTYGQHIINSDEAKLIFSKSMAILYDNIIYNNINTELYADKMEIDLITKDSKIYMKDTNSKVKIIYKK